MNATLSATLSAVPELRPISRPVVRCLLAALDARAKSHPGEKWTSRRERNGRGDYGVSETFYAPSGLASHVISIDGGRSDVRFYLSPFSPFADLLS